MANWKRLLGVGIVAYVLFLIGKIPASVVLPLLNQRLPNGTVSLSEPQGSIWSGSIDLTISQMARGVPAPGPVRLRWSFRPSDLLYGQFGADYWVKSVDLTLNGFVASGLGGSVLSVERGSVGAEWVNPLIRGRGAQIEKPIQLLGVYWEGELESKVTYVAQGGLNWEGGPVSVSQPVRMQMALPEIVARLSATERRTLFVDVQKQAGNERLLSAELLTTGGVKLRVLKRAQTLAGMGEPSDPDAVMIELEQQVL